MKDGGGGYTTLQFLTQMINGRPRGRFTSTMGLRQRILFLLIYFSSGLIWSLQMIHCFLLIWRGVYGELSLDTRYFVFVSGLKVKEEFY